MSAWPASVWVSAEAVDLCRRIEEVCPRHGFHVALTGGLLYKDGPRKDADLLFYRVRQRRPQTLDFSGLIAALSGIGLKMHGVDPAFEWCVRASWNGKPVDMFFPDAEEGEYGETELSDLSSVLDEHDQFADGGAF